VGLGVCEKARYRSGKRTCIQPVAGSGVQTDLGYLTKCEAQAKMTEKFDIILLLT